MITPISFHEKLPEILSRINELIDELNALQPRLLPEGGLAGYALTKTNPADYAVNWEAITSSGGTTTTAAEVVEAIAAQDGQQDIAFTSTGTRSCVFINGLLQGQSSYDIGGSVLTIPTASNVQAGDLLTVIIY